MTPKRERGERIYLTFKQAEALSIILDSILSVGYEEPDGGTESGKSLEDARMKIDRAFGWRK